VPGLLAILLPPEPRRFRGLRALKISLRAAHVLCAGVLTGAYVLEVPAGRGAWLAATLASGGAILAVDLYQTAAFLLQVRGLVLLVKVSLLLALPAFGGAARWVLAALVLLSVISSHAPSKVRYFVLVGRGRIRGSTAAG
jgi:hypothetical protein